MDLIRKLKFALAASGLEEDEINFYINVLKKPGSTIFDIARSSKLPKDRAYKIFHDLTGKKLLSEQKASFEQDSQRKHKHLVANPLESFIEDIYSKGRKFYHTADTLKEIKPFLSFLNLPASDTVIETFNAENLGEHWVDCSYMNWDSVLAYGNFEMMIDNMGRSPDQIFMRRRVQRGKKAYPTFTHVGQYTNEFILPRDDKELRQSKIRENEHLKNTWVTIFPDQDTISICLLDEKDKFSGAKIKNPIISKLHENIFKFLSS